MLEGGEDPVFRDAMMGNLSRALCTALLLLPDSFSAEELFMAIAGLSFKGECSCLQRSSNAAVLSDLVSSHHVDR